MTRLTRRTLLGTGLLAALAAGATRLVGLRRDRLAEALYDSPPDAPAGPLSVYHLGHSLVGRDMPAMLAQLAGAGHDYHSQLGWGTPLRDHWEPDLPINGFETENAHPRFRDARAAIASGQYDAVVLTEMVELRDALRYHESARYLATWAEAARAANPAVRLYLYETWHHLDDPAGWLDRIDADLPALWEGKLMLPAAARADAPIWIIPAGQALAAVARAVEAAGGVGTLTRREDLFARTPEGGQDTIHLSDQGSYLVALVHYATLYHRSPLDLPAALLRADGSPADAPDPEAAELMQRLAWDVVRAYPKTGVRA